VENFWVGALQRAAIQGDVENGSLMAGQSVGLIHDIKPMADIMRELVEDAEAELQRLQARFA
jgi:enoyl-[acyl-carrier protein] reductase II